jgi:acetolactate synthase-1/2/3 large subunit
MSVERTQETVAERVAQSLVRHEVKFIFAQSLPSAVILAAEARGIQQISYRQENMGGAMADGYARLSGKVGVVAAQNGPAATLLVAPLAEALKASIPVVALVQDVERDQTDKNAFQDIDQIGLFQACTKWVRRVGVEHHIEDYIDAAFTAAASGRPGPVALLLPADLLRAPMPEDTLSRRHNLGAWPLDRQVPQRAALEEAADLIARARAPVVVAGGGVHGARAYEALAALQDIAALPVCTTNMGKGAVSEDHPLSLGVIGSLTGPRSLGRHTSRFVTEADVVLLIGTRTNQNGTDSWKQIGRQAKVIHIDTDPCEIGRNYEALRLVGDARETIEALVTCLKQRDLTRSAARRPKLEQDIEASWKSFEADRLDVYQSEAAPIRPERVMQALQPWLEKGLITVADASYSSMWILGQLRARQAGPQFVTPRGLAGLGWGVPLAMGAKLARPDRPVVAVVGDGGFAHSWAEIETMIRHGIAVTTIVLNNGILGFQKDAETVKFGRYTSACHFAPVEHWRIAEACGCKGVRVDQADQLQTAIDEAIGSQAPRLIEIIADPAAHPPLSLFAGMDSAA